MRKLQALFFCMTFFLIGHVIAQTKQVSGTVRDTLGNPIPNVSVQVRKSSIGTRTNDAGSFMLQVPNNAVLVISSIGYETQEINVANRNDVQLVMHAARNLNMQEVVVVAYGTARKGSFTGAVTSIDSRQLEKRPITNVTNALAGAAPGVVAAGESGQPGAGAAIRIRGFGSVNASNSPLYVVDGIPYPSVSANPNAGLSIANINVNDIESVSVLKDAPATALYGSKAANGVILITTKKGKKGQTRIQVNASQGVLSRGIPEYDRVSPQDYYVLMWEAYRNSLAYRATNPIPLADASKIASGLYPRFTSGSNAGKQNYNGTAFSDISQLLAYNPFNVASTDIVRENGTINPNAQLLYPDDLDWGKAMERRGSRGDYNVAFSGGGETNDYYVSLGYLNEKGFANKTDFKRYTGRINLNVRPFTWFGTGFNMTGTASTSDVSLGTPENSTAFVNPFNFARNMGSIYPVHAHDPVTGAYLYDNNGQMIYDLGNMTTLGLPTRPAGANPGRHAIAETELNDNLFKRNILSARTYGEIKYKDFKFTTNIGADFSNYQSSRYENRIVGDAAPAGRSTQNDRFVTNITLNELLNYSRTFGNHSIDALVGHEDFDYTYKTVGGIRTGQVVDNNTELTNFTTITSLTSSTDKLKTESYLSRLNYTYQNRYFLSGSFRRDGSSRFFEDNRWGNFWSVGLAWRIDNEAFIKKYDWINGLKLRTSYGEVGNDAILDNSTNPPADVYYAYQSFYSLGYNNATDPGVLFSTLENKAITWETNKQYDAGLEFSLFKNRFTGTVEYFYRKSDNLLFSVPLPLSTGNISINRNIGSMYNKGMEVQLGADIIRTKDFTWNFSINATKFKNSITQLPPGQSEIISGTKKLMVGHSIYDYWLREWYGVDPDDGAGLYRADVYNASNSRIKGKDTVTTTPNNARFHYAGSAIPDVYGGINNSFNYKGFDFSFLLTYQLGGKVYDATWAALMDPGRYGAAMHVDLLKRWQNPGDITNVPRMDNAQLNNFGAASDRWLVDASYLNIKSASFGYALPRNIASRLHLQSARIYVSGENLQLFAKRKGMNVTQAFTGVTTNGYLPARIFSTGINIQL